MSASGSLSVIDVGGESWQRRLDGITAARLELAAAEGQAGDGEQAARQLMAAQWLVDDGVICALATLILGSQTLKLQLNAGFERTIPASHPYIANYMQHHTELKGLGNAVRILTNLILLPILLSCSPALLHRRQPEGGGAQPREEIAGETGAEKHPICRFLDLFPTRGFRSDRSWLHLGQLTASRLIA